MSAISSGSDDRISGVERECMMKGRTSWAEPENPEVWVSNGADGRAECLVSMGGSALSLIELDPGLDHIMFLVNLKLNSLN